MPRPACSDAHVPGFLPWLSHAREELNQQRRVSIKLVVATDASDDADLTQKLSQAAARIREGQGLREAANRYLLRLWTERLATWPSSSPARAASTSDMGGTGHGVVGATAAWDGRKRRDEYRAPSFQDVVFPIPVFTDEDEAALKTRKLVATEWAQPAIGVTSSRSSTFSA